MYQDELEELSTCLTVINKLVGDFEPNEEDLIRQLMLNRALQITEKLKSKRE